MKSIYEFTIENIESYLINNNGKKYNARQIFEWLYFHKVSDFNKMTNLKKDLVNHLNENFKLHTIKIEQKQVYKDAIKYLFSLFDGNYIEAVLMKHNYGNSICISSEVGCNMACSFCESGRLKMQRKLTSGEMVEQILLVESDLQKRIDSVVIMGIGEPFDNYDEVLKFIRIINHPYGLAIGARHITISTCGIIPKIKAFAEENIQVNLAVSLHAPNDKLRTQLMPINKAYPLNKLIDSLKDYISKTNRRVTIEYVMLNNINDSEVLAKELAILLKGMNIYVNLIPYNETSHLEYKKSPKERIMKFYDILVKHKINVTIRKEYGNQIDAACGQLRAKEVEK